MTPDRLAAVIREHYLHAPSRRCACGATVAPERHPEHIAEAVLEALAAPQATFPAAGPGMMRVSAFGACRRDGRKGAMGALQAHASRLGKITPVGWQDWDRSTAAARLMVADQPESTVAVILHFMATNPDAVLLEFMFDIPVDELSRK